MSPIIDISIINIPYNRHTALIEIPYKRLTHILDNFLILRGLSLLMMQLKRGIILQIRAIKGNNTYFY